MRRKVLYLAIVVGLLGAVYWHSRTPSELEPVLRRESSSAVQAWTAPARYRFLFQDQPLSEAFRECERRTGIRFHADAGPRTVSLDVRDVPFWEAVSALSAATGRSFRVNANPDGVRKSRQTCRIDFDGVPFHDQRYVGPFHFGLFRETIDAKEYDLIQVSCLPKEGTTAGPGCVMAYADQGDRFERLTLDEVLPGDRTRWRRLTREPALVVHALCEVNSDPTRISVPLKTRTEVQTNAYGGTTVSTRSTVAEGIVKVHYSIRWGSAGDAKHVAKFAAVTKLERAWDVLDQANRFKILRVASAELASADGNEIACSGSWLEQRPDRIDGYLVSDFANDIHELRLIVHAAKFAVAVVRFGT